MKTLCKNCRLGHYVDRYHIKCPYDATEYQIDDWECLYPLRRMFGIMKIRIRRLLKRMAVITIVITVAAGCTEIQQPCIETRRDVNGISGRDTSRTDKGSCCFLFENGLKNTEKTEKKDGRLSGKD